MPHALVKNKTHKKIILLVFLMHSIFVAFLGLSGCEGSWAGFFVFLLDFPISLLYIKENVFYFYFSSILLGSIWWCFLILTIFNAAKWAVCRFGKFKKKYSR